MSIECTTDDCQNQTHTYLCGRCISDLQAWIDMVPPLITALNVTIAKLDNVRPAGGGGGGGHKPGSDAPINLDALQLQENLRSVNRTLASEHAKDPHAAGVAWLIQDWVTKAERMVSGPDEPPVNHHENRERVKGIAPAMPTRQLVPWLRQNAKVVVTSMDIRNWVRRGKLRAAEEAPQPTYHPHEVLDAWYETRRAETRT